MKVRREDLIGYLLDAALWNLHENYFAEEHGMDERAAAHRERGEMAKALAMHITDPANKALDFDC